MICTLEVYQRSCFDASLVIQVNNRSFDCKQLIRRIKACDSAEKIATELKTSCFLLNLCLFEL
jgi:hypothetical protein